MNRLRSIDSIKAFKQFNETMLIQSMLFFETMNNEHEQ